MQDPLEDLAHDLVRLVFKLWRNFGSQPLECRGG